MAVETNNRSDEKVWNRGRNISLAVSLAVILSLGIVSQLIGDVVPVANAATTEPVNANAPVAAAPPAINDMPLEVAVVPLKDANGASFKLGDFFGKVTVINLWATWCGPCRQEIPELVKLNKEFQPRGVEMIGLSTENPDASAEKVRKFIQDFQIDYRIGWASVQVTGPLMQEYQAIPQTFVISRDARILKRFVGFSPASTSAQLKQVLEDALK